MSSSFGYFGFQPRSRIAFSAEATSLGGIARAAWFFEGGDLFASDFFAHADDFAHRVAVAVAQVVEALRAGCQGEYVSLGEIHDVDVIADAGAVGRRIVG